MAKVQVIFSEWLGFYYYFRPADFRVNLHNKEHSPERIRSLPGSAEWGKWNIYARKTLTPGTWNETKPPKNVLFITVSYQPVWK